MKHEIIFIREKAVMELCVSASRIADEPDAVKEHCTKNKVAHPAVQHAEQSQRKRNREGGVRR